MAGEMAEWISAHTAPTEDLSSIPSIHNSSKSPVTPASKDLKLLASEGIYTHKHISTHRHIIQQIMMRKFLSLFNTNINFSQMFFNTCSFG